MEDKLDLALEKLRREYDIILLKLEEKHKFDFQVIISRLDQQEEKIQRINNWMQRQSEQLEKLLQWTQRAENEAKKAITPANLRNWIIGTASFIGAVMLLVGVIENYNQSQVIKAEEKAWIEEQRGQTSVQ